MTRVQYFTACTLDGFIADESHSLDWLLEVPRSDDEDWDDFLSAVGVMSMGAHTYEWVVERERLLENPRTWQAYYGDRPTWVFTHRQLPQIPGADLRFVSGDVRARVRRHGLSAQVPHRCPAGSPPNGCDCARFASRGSGRG